MKASFQKYILNFKTPSGTSRGVLHFKETYILEILNGDEKGIGECALFKGLSVDDTPYYIEKLQWACNNVKKGISFLIENLPDYPSIIIGFEQAFHNLKHKNDIYFPSKFTENKDSIEINGLIWMGNIEFMQKQIEEKIEKGFTTLKLKIGVDWEKEFQLLKKLRTRYSDKILTLRVDANGAFNYNESLHVLEQLATLKIHSIEQPIKAKQIMEMEKLCKITPTPIALDEELIGIYKEKEELLNFIKPQFIILKPSLMGGFSACEEWIRIAESLSIPYWITSALESNIGLNAIAQWTYSLNPKLPQGLGTGGLFTNNLKSSLYLENNKLWKRV